MSIKTILLLSTLSISLQVTAEPKVIHMDTHGFIVENQIQIAKKPDVVWHALVNQVDSWWPKDHSWWGQVGTFSIEAKAGGCFCEVSGDNSAEHMRISFVEPNKLLRMTGGLGPLQGMGMFGALDWQLKATDKGTQVTLIYRVSGIDPNGFEKLAPIVAKVQGIQLDGLGEYLAN